MEGMANMSSAGNKKRIIVLLGVDRQWSSHGERNPTLQRIRGKTSDTLYRSVAPTCLLEMLLNLGKSNCESALTF
ncbi:hypothetical protein TNCV_3812571 [Trichonephila clavipes]|nr:hypothetical protein TNCV_3812571 [Trichonephila clavipes]